jgi:hypothetical protein
MLGRFRGQVNEVRGFAALSSGCCRKIVITLKIPRLGNQSVSDTWSLAKIVREVEFKLLQLTVVMAYGTI